MLSVKDFEFNFDYPDAIERLVALKLINFDLWYLMSKEQSMLIHKQVKMECRYKGLVPFARRGDNDDVACFEIENNEKVVVLKQCEFLGFRPRQEFDTVWDWFRDAIEIMIAY